MELLNTQTVTENYINFVLGKDWVIFIRGLQTSKVEVDELVHHLDVTGTKSKRKLLSSVLSHKLNDNDDNQNNFTHKTIQSRRTIFPWIQSLDTHGA